MSAYIIQSTTLTGLADAVRTATGKSEAFTPSQMISELTDYVPDVLAGLDFASVDTPSTTYESPVKYIGEYAFRFCSNVQTLSFPNAVGVATGAFELAYSLQSIYLPKCKWIDPWAFRGDSGLTYLDLPECEWIGNTAFSSCTNLLRLRAPNLVEFGVSSTSGGYGTFTNCSKLTEFSFPKLQSVVSSLFNPLPGTAIAYDISFMSLPNVSSIAAEAFSTFSLLTSAYIPKCTYIGNSAFVKCSNLTQIYLNEVSAVTTISGSTFYSNGAAITSVYVPSSLYSAFLTAQWWSTRFSKKLVPV